MALPTDAGVIAHSEESEEPIGAAWFRFFGADDPGFGFVAEHPEVAIGVVEAAEAKGSGRRCWRPSRTTPAPSD